jgi:membrane protease YdiL (CAAX protease family)
MKPIKNEPNSAQRTLPVVPWNPFLGVFFVILIFFVSQLMSALLISVYPSLNHWTNDEASAWLNNSVIAQFTFILLAETFVLGAIYLFLKRYNFSFKDIGLRRPRWSDLGFALALVPVYFVLYLATVLVVSHFVPGLQVDQPQDIGFGNVHGSFQLTLTFISLVILPPLTEEILVRGFLYSSLKKALPLIGAVIMTSLLFAAAHLPEGGDAGPLYIAAIDTFILSLVLIYLREKTNGLWASIILHAIKNGVAFTALFILHTR